MGDYVSERLELSRSVGEPPLHGISVWAKCSAVLLLLKHLLNCIMAALKHNPATPGAKRRYYALLIWVKKMEWKITQEAKLAEAFEGEIIPFWKQAVTTSAFNDKHDVKVHYAWCVPPEAHSTVVISSGRIESLLKYKELIYDLYQNGFAAFILDHRGQGLSGRLTDDPHHGYVDTFDDYVDDLLYFVNQFVLPKACGATNLVCHSMGGAIGALAMIRAPELFSKAVLCSPMFGIRPALPAWLAAGLIHSGLWINRLRKRRSGYFFGQRRYLAYPFAINNLTHSEIRYQLFRRLYDQTANIQLGGVTTEWLHAAQEAMDKIEHQAADITTPLLVFSAGKDKIIDNRRQQKIVRSMPDAKLEIVEGAYHELFTESDKFRVPVLQQLMAFLHASTG